MHAGEQDAIGKRKRCRKRIVENFAAHGIGTRFQYRPNSAARPTQTGGVDGGVNGGGVVGEIVYNQNACDLALYVHAALNAVESVECFANCGGGDASALCDNDCREGVQNIVAARSVEGGLSKILPRGSCA